MGKTHTQPLDGKHIRSAMWPVFAIIFSYSTIAHYKQVIERNSKNEKCRESERGREERVKGINGE